MSGSGPVTTTAAASAIGDDSAPMEGGVGHRGPHRTGSESLAVRSVFSSMPSLGLLSAASVSAVCIAALGGYAWRTHGERRHRDKVGG